MAKNKSELILEEERVTPRVIGEQAVRILCVVGFLFVAFLPIIICDALGSVAPNFSAETGIPITAGSGDSQTAFFFSVWYLIKNSAEAFLPVELFKVGAQWITSTMGAGATFYGVLGAVCMVMLYILPIYLYVVLIVSRFYEGNPIDKLRTVGVPVCGVLYLFCAGILGSFSIGYLWNFFWEYDTHYDFALQFFAAYGGVKISILAVISLLIAIGCGALTVMYKKNIE